MDRLGLIRFLFLVPGATHASIVLYSLEWEWLGFAARATLALIGSLVWLGGEAFAFAAAPRRPTPVWGWATILALAITAAMTVGYYANAGRAWEVATRLMIAIAYGVSLSVYVFLLLLAWEQGEETIQHDARIANERQSRLAQAEMAIRAEEARAAVIRAETARLRAESKRVRGELPPPPAPVQLPAQMPAQTSFTCYCGAVFPSLAQYAAHKRWAHSASKKT